MRKNKVVRIDVKLDEEIKKLKNQFNLQISENEIICKCLELGIEKVKKNNLTILDFKKKVIFPKIEVIKDFFENLKTENYYKAAKKTNITVNAGLKLINLFKENKFIKTKQGQKTIFLKKELTSEDIQKII